MRLIYSQGFSKTERMEWKPIIYNNIVQSFRLIGDVMIEMGIGFSDPGNEVG